MRLFHGIIFWVLLFLIAFSGVAFAKPLAKVYLKDGGIIECQTVRLKGDTYFAKVNHELVVEVAKEEVAKVQVYRKHKKKGVKRVNKGAVIDPVQPVKPVAGPAKAESAPVEKKQ